MQAKLINHQKLNRTFFELPAGLIWTRLLLAGVVIAIRFCSTISRNVRLPLFLGRLLSVLATSLSESATGAGFLRIFSGLTNTDSSSSSSRLIWCSEPVSSSFRFGVEQYSISSDSGLLLSSIKVSASEYYGSAQYFFNIRTMLTCAT